jgi:precorrin-6B methylase 1
MMEEKKKTALAQGSLIVVGSGIRVVGQLTMESIAWMKKADRLLYVVGDRVAAETIHYLNPNGAESLARYYADGKPRMQTYREIVDRILACVRDGMLTCVVTYGHPGVFAYPSHEAIRQARAEGFPARMLPGISAEDCLFADLGIDPATNGCQSYDATDFLVHRRSIDPSAAVVLWQIGAIGDPLSRKGGNDVSALALLVDRLCQFHPHDHICYTYQAAVYPGSEPLIRPAAIRALAQSIPPAMSTLYIPPSRTPTPDPILAGRIASIANGGGRAAPTKD